MSFDASYALLFTQRLVLEPELELGAAVWSWRFGETADLAQAGGEELSDVRFVAGLRVWY